MGTSQNQLSKYIFAFALIWGVIKSATSAVYAAVAIYYPVPVSPIDVAFGTGYDYHSSPLYHSSVEPWLLTGYVFVCLWTLGAIFGLVFGKRDRYPAVLTLLFVHCVWHYYASFRYSHLVDFGLAFIGVAYGALYIYEW